MKKIKLLPLLISGAFLLPIMTVTANAEWSFDPFWGFIWVEEESAKQAETMVYEEILYDEEILLGDWDFCLEWEKWGCKCAEPVVTEPPKPKETKSKETTPKPAVTTAPATTSAPAKITAPAVTTTTVVMPKVTEPVITEPPVIEEPLSEPEPETKPKPEIDMEDMLPDDWTAPNLDGIGTVVEYVMDGEGKIFYTISTAEGNVFYIVVDQNRNSKNVYLLHTVSNADLAMLTEGGGAVTESAVPEVIIPEPEPEVEVIPEPPDKKKSNNGATLFILIAAAVVGVVGYYFKVIKPKKDAESGGFDDDFDDEDFDVDGYNDDLNEGGDE